ncbi:MAG: transketolase [Flavobacteriales bacterium]|nr:transketolase [Flavobacteriales bacterium]
MADKKSIQELNDIASQVRRDIVRMVHAVQSGHPGGSLGCTEFMVALYFEIMNYHPRPFNMSGEGEDVFILSNGHISPVFYSVMARAGIFEVSELATFRKINSRLQGHPATHEKLEGVRIASGSLGQGLSVATGIALSKKINGDTGFVYCLMGDGELQEGQNWEAIMFAAHNGVDNLIATVDFNGQQIDGSTKEIMGFEKIKDKFEAFGWITLDMQGNDIGNVIQTIRRAQELSGKGKPVMINMKTEMGYGVDFMMGSHEWHGIAPNNDQLASALGQLTETLGDY